MAGRCGQTTLLLCAVIIALANCKYPNIHLVDEERKINGVLESCAFVIVIGKLFRWK